MADRFMINRDFRPFISALQSHNILGTKELENKDIFELAAALGMADPQPVQNKDGYINFRTIKVEDKAILDAIYLGTATSNEDIDKMADFDLVAQYTEQCAESGFKKLREMVESAGYDNKELIERRMLNDLDNIFLKNVEGFLE